jgi:hypothetical protein
MEAQKRMPERRRFERVTVLWSGHLVFREQVVPCLIVNISAGGAMVRTEEAAACVSSVVLRNPRIGDLEAQVTWRTKNELGLRFLDDDKTVAAIIGKALR